MSKIALVIGNSIYGGTSDVSGAEDATAIAKSLAELGFDVLGGPLLNGNLKAASDALENFGQRIEDASAALFFYSGHGFQAGGKNYLLPPDGPVSIEGSLLLDDIVQTMGLAPNEAVKLVFVNACRGDGLLPDGATGEVADAPEAPAGVVQAFAASPGQEAASGSKGALSPYTAALLRYLPQAGLALGELFDRVRADVSQESVQQQKTLEVGALPAGFFFRPPVFVQAEYPLGKSELLVFLRGELILDTSELPTQDPAAQTVKTDLRLNTGDNELVLLVANGRVHHNNHDWDVTEGWSYHLDLTLPDGSVETFEGSEDIPFKDGPHYGKVFRVAQVNLQVDPQSGVLSLLELKKDLANEEAPFFGSDQQVLVEVSIADLTLSPDDILGDALGTLPAFLKPFLVEFLKSGTVLGATIADPAKTFVLVLGNSALKDLAVAAMADRPARIAGLKASIAAAFRRDPTPFKIFDEGLMNSMRVLALNQVNPPKPDDIRIWTALHDRSNDPPVAAPAVADVTAPDPVPVG
jgi:hypothetical protein